MTTDAKFCTAIGLCILGIPLAVFLSLKVTACSLQNTRKLPENALISTVCDSPRIYRFDYEGSSYLITGHGYIINHPRKGE